MARSNKPRRGRPPKGSDPAYSETRLSLIRTGLAVLTEKGYSYTGIDEILKKAGVPKGSFYHYFKNKEAFGEILIDAYGKYFARKLERWLEDTSMPPLQRLAAFVEDAGRGMAVHEFKRGCLIGNLGQEMSALPESFRNQLTAVLQDWQQRTCKCLQEAQQSGEMQTGLDAYEQAAFFWIGWEGAVLRAKLDQSTEPLNQFAAGFFRLIKAT
ncbi:TetR/AcrR family transcriptional regulator [Marinospirillum celere]|uniref:acrylate utilization transcriptional regulator AcuR n=1 Tax=Marinospirillum celere TaxID=1122252 RepID=UPI001FE09A13|nr:TetR/AcrR family transcriptional regulator [Marinospirillum celere]